jgi:flagellar basal-body rod protein FlgC
MSVSGILSGMDISASGLSAERMRMDVVANNIANINSTRSPGGGPYRRQQVAFAAAMNQLTGGGVRRPAELQGVRVLGVMADQSGMPKIHDPGHPDADASGFVEMPNVSLPREMVDMITASRAYEANLKSLEIFRELAEQSLGLLRGLG